MKKIIICQTFHIPFSIQPHITALPPHHQYSDLPHSIKLSQTFLIQPNTYTQTCPHILVHQTISISKLALVIDPHIGKKNRTINVILQKTALKPKHKHTDTNTC